MFDFEKFPVYIKTELLINKLQPIVRNRHIYTSTRDQLYRASSSILLNIAEGAAKYSKKEKKNFYLTARASAQECVAIIKLLKIESHINNEFHDELYNILTEICKMLSGLINFQLQYIK